MALLENPNYRKASNLIFLSVLVGILNSYLVLRSPSGNMNGAGMGLLLVFTVLFISFGVAIICGILIRHGKSFGKYLFCIHVIIGLFFTLQISVNLSDEYYFFILRCLQAALQIWAIVVLGQASHKSSTSNQQ